MTHVGAIRGAVFDIDGTLAMMDKATGTFTALPGAVAAIKACGEAGIPVVAYTNGTFFPPAHYYPLLADAGIVIEPGHLLTPAGVAARYLAEQGYKRVMVLGGEGTRVPLLEAGFDVVDPVAGQEPVEAVMTGWTPDFDVPKLEAICEAVWAGAKPFTASDAPFFAGAKGRMIGISGAIAAMVTRVTGESPVVLGKPSVLGLEMVAKLLGAEVTEIAVIGDDPLLEIKMARAAGALAIGVTTGISNADAFAAVEAEFRAHQVLSSLESLPVHEW